MLENSYIRNISCTKNAPYPPKSVNTYGYTLLRLRLDNTGAWVIEVISLLLINHMP